jgi:hypothetical protein|tara:strand:- start:731 stop:1018 length:288 start_codon:yes stop_codon:yes gene_type:complete
MEDNVTKLRKARKTNQKRDWTWPSFVEAWQTSESYDEVLEKLGFDNTPKDRSFIGVKASYARKKGVKLKKLQRKRRNSNIDWQGLANLAKEKSDA